MWVMKYAMSTEWGFECENLGSANDPYTKCVVLDHISVVVHFTKTCLNWDELRGIVAIV